MSSAETAEPIEMPFRLWTRVVQETTYYAGVRIPQGKGRLGGISRPIEKYLGYLAWAKVIRLVAAAMRPFAVSIAATCCILSKSDQLNILAMVKPLQPMCQVSLTSSSLCPEKI